MLFPTVSLTARPKKKAPIMAKNVARMTTSRIVNVFAPHIVANVSSLAPIAKAIMIAITTKIRMIIVNSMNQTPTFLFIWIFNNQSS